MPGVQCQLVEGLCSLQSPRLRLMEVLSRNVSPLSLQSWGNNVASHILAVRASSGSVTSALTLLDRASSMLSLTSAKRREVYPIGP